MCSYNLTLSQNLEAMFSKSISLVGLTSLTPQLRLFIKLLGQVESISHRSFSRSCLFMHNPFRDDKALPDPEVICVVDRIDTPLFMKPIRQRATTQQWLIQEDELNTNVAKFNAPFINSWIVSHSRSRKVSFAPDPFILQAQMLEFTLFYVFLNLA